MGMKKEQFYCGYTFRHTWATIAQNDCDANISDVAFGLNHSHGYNVTRGYVKIDFTPAWELNAKIIDFVFFSNKRSKQGKARDLEESGNKLFRISPKMMIRARAYFKGEVVAELTNIGFSNINQVITSLTPSNWQFHSLPVCIYMSGWHNQSPVLVWWYPSGYSHGRTGSSGST